MKWENDPDRYEKYMILDAIVKYSYEFKNREASAVSIKELSHFIDDFITMQKFKDMNFDT